MKYKYEEIPLISEITQWIMELMRTHGQLSVFIGVMIEQIIVPIPSPLIIMGAGAILISARTFHSQCLPSDSVGHCPSRFHCLDTGFLYRIYHQFLWRESPGRSAPAFFGCGLGSDRKIGETIPGEERSVEHLSLPGHSRLPHLSGFHLCRFASHSYQTLHDLYVFGFDLPMFFPWFFWMVDRSDLRKSSHSLRFGRDDRLHFDVDRDGCGFWIPLSQI